MSDAKEAEQVAVLGEIAEAVGADRVSTEADLLARHSADWTGWSAGRPLALVRPRTVEEVSRVLATCNAHRQPVAVQGGLTGLCGGASTRSGEIALSLERLKGVETIDGGAMTVLAGTTVAEAQDAARAAGAALGIDFGARGSAAIGGAIATNAGGLHVIETGMTRAQVLGLEVVLADGRVLSELTPMVKVNSGFDLKQLFIGSEGALGIITRAVLALHPARQGLATAALALHRSEDALVALSAARRALGPDLSAFEAMWPDYVRTMTERTAFSFPFKDAPLCLIVEARDATAAARMEAFLEAGAEAGWLADATLAASVAQARALWALRDEGPAAYPQIFTVNIAFDVSVPSARILEAARRLGEVVPAGDHLHPLTYGHLGDQNLHFVVGADRPVAAQEKAQIERAVYEVVTELDGAISAEHGIGQLKKPYLSMSRGPLALEIMAGLKGLLDPAGILNPGRVVD